MNPIGLQCQKCGYTQCRECGNRRSQSYEDPVDMPEDPSGPCPAFLCGGWLTIPVLPTGRSDVEPMDPNDIECVLVARDGVIPPTMDQALQVVTKFFPLTVEDSPIIHIRRSVPGVMTNGSIRDELAMLFVHDLERAGKLAPEAWERSRRIFVLAGAAADTDYLVTMVRKPHS